MTTYSCLLAAIVAVANADTHTWVTVCKSHCHLDGSPTIHNALAHSCNKYKFTAPRPKVYRICRDGFESAVAEACHNHCHELGHSAGKAEETGGTFCKQYRQHMPKPGAFQACTAGYRAGSASASASASAFRVEFEEKLKLGESPAEAEQELETEAVYEENLAKSTPEDREVEASLEEEKAAAAKGAADKAAADKAAAEKAKQDLDVAREAAKAAFEAQKSAEAAADGGLEEIDF